MFRKFTNREKEELVDLTLIEVALGNDKKKMIFGFFFLLDFPPFLNFYLFFTKLLMIMFQSYSLPTLIPPPVYIFLTGL